jgi:SAM-dependent methyltransferase
VILGIAHFNEHRNFLRWAARKAAEAGGGCQGVPVTMHDTAYEIARKVFEFYARPGQMIVELGSQNVNGTVRDFCPAGATFLGFDVGAGCGVDIVVRPGEPLPVRSDFADLIVASSVFEHDECFWETFLELVRLLKPGGVLYINAPSNGKYHRYPIDCWRFYPDSGPAFMRLARKKGYPLTLVESFVAERQQDCWNDFAALYVKADTIDQTAVKFVSDHIPCTNNFRFGSEHILLKREITEDMHLIQNLRREIEELRALQAKYEALPQTDGTRGDEQAVSNSETAAVSEGD